uniref:Putative secreted protein n=1 Tax=Anopheles darlingi TaxID=43151 RepID=A0A2M4DJ22_ANODA
MSRGPPALYALFLSRSFAFRKPARSVYKQSLVNPSNAAPNRHTHTHTRGTRVAYKWEARPMETPGKSEKRTNHGPRAHPTVQVECGFSQLLFI